MRWCRIRLVLLGLLLCVVHVVSGTCGQNFIDPSSSALLADVVIEGKVRSTSNPDEEETYNITVAVKKNILKGGELINRGRPAKTITVDRFTAGAKDALLCLGNVQKGRTYFFFLKDTKDRKGLYFKIMAMPMKKSKKILTELKGVLCQACAKPPTIKYLAVPKKEAVGMNISMNCSVESNPAPLFSWFKNGVLIKTKKDKYKISSRKLISTLEVRQSAPNDTGEYTCVAKNILGEARKTQKLKVMNPHHPVPCEIQTFCLNGGTCMHIPALTITFCKCPEPWAGRRCEHLDGIRVSEDYNRQASLLLERTLIIIGIVIAVLVFIIICIVSYVLAKKARQRFEQRRKRRQAQLANENRPGAISVDSRNMSQPTTNKQESLIRSEMLSLNMASKQPGQIMLQDSSSPPASQSPQGHFGEFPQQLLHSETKVHPNGSQNEPRGRLAASSVYDNFKSAELSQFLEGGDLHRNKEALQVGGAPTGTVEMKTPSENEKEEITRPQPETCLVAGIFTTNNNVLAPVDVSVSQPVQCSDPPPSLPHYHHFNETRPVPMGSSVASSSEPSAPSLGSPSKDSPQRFHNHVFSLNENDTAVQPLLPNHKKHLPMSPHVQPQRPFESKSDKDLSRYLPLSGKQQGPYDIRGYTNDISENKRLLRDLSKLSHSNTFPKPKMNGLSSDTLSESDGEDTSQAPCEQQLDLYISEDDLGLSKENLVNSSFSIVSAPSRQASHEDHGLGLIRNSGRTRQGIRKHQSEENPNYNKIVNKSHTFLQDNARTRSLDNPPGRAGVSPDPKRLNSTVAGSPDVETYDNIVPQPGSQLHNHTYAYDPNDDSTPWDGEMSTVDQRSSLTEEDRDRFTRLKDVLPDQQAIPI